MIYGSKIYSKSALHRLEGSRGEDSILPGRGGPALQKSRTCSGKGLCHTCTGHVNRLFLHSDAPNRAQTGLKPMLRPLVDVEAAAGSTVD